MRRIEITKETVQINMQFKSIVLTEIIRLAEGNNAENACNLLDFHALQMYRTQDIIKAHETAEELAKTFIGKYRKSIIGDIMGRLREAIAQIEVQND